MAEPSSTSTENFRALALSLSGDVRSRQHAEYADWHGSATWNGRVFARHPAYIVRARSVEDVVATVDFARENRLSLSVKSGGHSYGGCFLRDDGMLLDLADLNALEVDTDTATARAQPAVTSRQLAGMLARHGLAFPTGHGADVAVGGFLLGGGLGINFRAWGGMSVFNVEAIDVVTADGQLRHASPRENAELFWAARGAGPTQFFVIVKYYLKCWPLPRAITLNTYRVPLDALVPTLLAIDALAPDPRIQVMVAIVPGQDGHHREAIMNTIAFADDPGGAKAIHASVIDHLDRFPIETVSEDQATDFEGIYAQGDLMLQSKRYRTDNILTDRIEEAVGILVAHLPAQPSPASLPLIIWRGESTLPDAAFSGRGRFFLSTYAQWSEATEDEANHRWLKDLYDALHGVASGAYINEFDLEERSDDVAMCFSPENWRRLRALRQEYDPHGVFQDVVTLSAETRS